jgi:hypothetical protein
VPRRAEAVLKALVRRGHAAIAQRRYHGYLQERPVALRDPELSGFSGEQIAIVDQVIGELWGKNARDVSDLSHEFVGWRVAEDGETIPYEMALVDVGPPTEEEEQYALRLVEEGR